MTARELLSKLSVAIYESPRASMRETGEIADRSNPLAVAMLVIDFDTEVSMSGMADFIGNSSGRYAAETVDALRAIGCPADADKLEIIVEAASEAGMTHAAMQADREGLELFSISSFAKTHGAKWDEACLAISAMAETIDHAAILERLEAYVMRNRSILEPAVG
jgi:hypothetical protein